MGIKKFKTFDKVNEDLTTIFPSNKAGSGSMKKFVVTTKSESSDDYIYFIKHPQKPTNEEMDKWLIENGSDVFDGISYENVEKIVEIEENKFKTL